MKAFKLLAIAALLLTTACQSSGRTYAEMVKTNAFLPIEQDKGRVFLYRYSTLGFAIQPPLRIDGIQVGDSVAEGFFYVDLPAGEHRATAETEVEKSLAFMLNKDETVYIKQSPALGWLVGRIELEKAEPIQAKNELTELKYQKDSAPKK